MDKRGKKTELGTGEIPFKFEFKPKFQCKGIIARAGGIQ